MIGRSSMIIPHPSDSFRFQDSHRCHITTNRSPMELFCLGVTQSLQNKYVSFQAHKQYLKSVDAPLAPLHITTNPCHKTVFNVAPWILWAGHFPLVGLKPSSGFSAVMRAAMQCTYARCSDRVLEAPGTEFHHL